MKLEWIREIDWKKGLTDELRMVLEACGEDAVLNLMRHLSGHRIYVSTAPLRAAQREYVRKFRHAKPARAMAFELGVSESFVRKVLLEDDPD